MSDLYEADILLWSEQQAAAIRRRAANEIDWENVAEEIEVPHWRAEARGQRGEARERFTASMRQRIDIAKLYREALHRMPEIIDGTSPLPVPTECPVTLDEMLAEAA